MATTPTPRSFSQIFGTMLGTFRHLAKLAAVQIGDPSVSILEAAAQSDFRNTQEILKAQAWVDLNNRTGAELDATGASIGRPRLSATRAQGVVTITDSAVTPVSGVLANGAVAGATVLTLSDAGSFPASGSVYVGRDSGAEEGPFTFTRVGVLLTLGASISGYHQSGERVVLAQGGARAVPAGTAVLTSPNAAGAQIRFRTTSAAVIADGDTSVDIDVECQQTGVAGNVTRGAISAFATLPFSTATVTNALKFTSGRATERDDDYREGIRAARDEGKATGLALVSGLLGTQSPDEPGTVTSAVVADRFGKKAIVVDDGTGYQNKTAGEAYEVLVANAVGGEDSFGVQNRPVAGAFLEPTVAAWTPVVGSILTVAVDDVPYEIVFSATDFASATQATAEELVAAINSANRPVYAQQVGGSFVVSPTVGTSIQAIAGGANDWLKFATSKKLPLRLYKNGTLLRQVGQSPIVESVEHGRWLAITTGATLNVEVDGVAVSITITNADFAARTSYSTASHLNSTDAWAVVLTAKLPGVTVTSVSGKLRFESNRGATAGASIAVIGGTFAEAVFESLPAEQLGGGTDFQFDPNLGQILLNTPLVAGDTLTLGTPDPRAFVSPLTSTPTLVSSAELWFVVDGGFSLPETGIGIGTATSWTVYSSPAWGQRLALAVPGAWTNAQSGDWVVITDAAVPAALRGAFRVHKIDSNTVHIERPAATLGGPASYTLTEGGLTLVRSSTAPQKVTVAGGTYTATSLAAALQVKGAQTSVSSGAVRISSVDPEGGLAVVGANTAGRALFVPVSVAANADVAVPASISTGVAFPSLTETSVTTGGTGTFTTATNADQFVLANFLGADRDGANLDRPSNAKVSTEISNGSTALTVSPSGEWLVGDRLFFSRGYDTTARDTLSVTVDGDVYSVPMSKQTSVLSVAGTWTLTETDGSSLAKVFGTSFDWTGFALSFRSRTKSHASPDTSKSILWRWWRYGPEGDDVRLQYQYPKAASDAVNVETQNVSDVIVRLGAGPARATGSVRASSKIGMAVTALAGGLYTHQFVANMDTTAAVRVVKLNYVNRGISVFAGTLTGATSGATATVVNDSNGAGVAATGTLTITPIAGTFLTGETITDAGAGTATTQGGTYGYTTLFLSLPGAITNHGIAVGETIYLNTGGGGISPGPKTVTTVGATTVSYIDTVATAATVGASVGSVSVDPAGEVTVNGTAVVTGDIFSGHNATSFIDTMKLATKVTVAAAGRSWTGVHTSGISGTYPLGTTLYWRNATGCQFFPLASNTAAQIATAVNGITTSPVSATAVGTAGVGTATGVPNAATFETTELGGTSPWWEFSDGFNWIRSHTTPVLSTDNFVFTLRNTVASALSSNADATNESPWLVPTTPRSTAAWLGSQVSGVGPRTISTATRDGRLILESRTTGSAGSIAVENSTTGTTVRGTGELLTAGVRVQVDSVDGLGGHQWVWVQNAIGDDKAVLSATTKLTSLTAAGVATFDSGFPKVWTRIGSLLDNQVVYIERQGPLVALHPLTTTFVNDGDYLRLQSCTAVPSGTTQLDAHNAGLFRVAKVTGNTVWIENSGVVEQLAGVKYDFVSRTSLVPGDTVVFGDSTWGDNAGPRLVTAFGATEWEVTLDTATPIQPVTTPTSLGAGASTFRVIAPPARLLKRVSTIGRGATGQLDVLLTPNTHPELLTEGYGTTIVVTGKLGFDGQTTVGADAYRYNTGLIAESARVVYGDELDVLTYPGIAAAGASYEITGPVIRRIQVALAVRCSTHTDDKRREIQSAVAGAINGHARGQAVALSTLTAAAARVPGVTSARMLTPSPSTDLIPVLSYEKARVFGLEENISITFVGE